MDEINELETLPLKMYPEVDIKTSKIRYLIVALLMLMIVFEEYQITFFVSTINFMCSYYNVTFFEYNLVNMFAMLLNFIFAFPIIWITERIGLRKSALIGSLLAVVTAIMKCLSHKPDSFIYLILAWIPETGFYFFFFIFFKVVIVWFPEHQLARATSSRMVSRLIGQALGYLLPAYILGSPKDTQHVSSVLLNMYASIAAIGLIIFISMVFMFDECPKFAPSAARFAQINLENEQRGMNLWSHLRNQFDLLQDSFTKKGISLLFIGVGLTGGVLISYQMTVSQSITLVPFEESVEKLVSTSGIIQITSGVLSASVCGYLLDRYHEHLKLMLIILDIFKVLALAIIIACLMSGSAIAVYLASSLLGMSMSGYLMVGNRLAIEISYPRLELISTAILYVIQQLIAIPISLLGSILLENYGLLAMGAIYILFLMAGTIADYFQTGEMTRRNVQLQRNYSRF